MTQKTLSIEVQGSGRYRTVHVRTDVVMGTLEYAVQVDVGHFALRHDAADERALVADAVLKALAEVVRHPGFGL